MLFDRLGMDLYVLGTWVVLHTLVSVEFVGRAKLLASQSGLWEGRAEISWTRNNPNIVARNYLRFPSFCWFSDPSPV